MKEKQGLASLSRPECSAKSVLFLDGLARARIISVGEGKYNNDFKPDALEILRPSLLCLEREESIKDRHEYPQKFNM